MIPFYDCLGRLACKGNPETGLVECLYKGNKTSAILAIGESFTVERQDIVTIITRVAAHDFKVDSRKTAAFFCSDWFAALTNIDGETLLRKLQEEEI